jgi:D-alanine-D-alanine ligase
MHKIRVGVLRGGITDYETSLKTGEMVVKHLPEHYHTEDIFITRDGKWHKHGLEIPLHHALSHVDVVFNALHGPYSEDGHIQHILEQHKIPFTGTGTFGHAISRTILHFKEFLKRHSIRPIPFKLIDIPTDGPGEELTSLFKTFAPPLIVRPVNQMGGVMIAHTFDDFVDMLEEGFKDADEILLEEYIPGTRASVGVIDGYRDHELYTLPPMSQAVLSHEAKRELEEIARQVHQALGMRHYSRVDFLVSPTRGIFVTQAVPLPSLHDDSAFHKSLTTVGAPVSHFLDHIVQLALKK